MEGKDISLKKIGVIVSWTVLLIAVLEITISLAERHDTVHPFFICLSLLVLDISWTIFILTTFKLSTRVKLLLVLPIWVVSAPILLITFLFGVLIVTGPPVPMAS